MDTGTWADWLAAIGTIASTLVVGTGLWWEMRQRRKSDEQADKERRAAEAQYAELVSVNMITVEPTQAQIEVINDGDAPIRKVTIIRHGPDGDQQRWPDGADGRAVVSAHESVKFLATVADNKIDVSTIENLFTGYRGTTVVDADRFDAEVEFTDAKGLRWCVNPTTGELWRVLNRQ